MGATLTMLLSLAIVLGLVLLLLAQLYCSLLLRRRHLRKPTTTATTASAAQLANHPTAPTLSTFYAQGVLHAPRNFLFPAVFNNLDLETQNSELPKKPHEVGLMFSSTPPPCSPAAFIPMASPKLVHGGEDGGATVREDCVYICNPIYDLEANMPCGAVVDTPFETPDSSPSRLSGSDGGQSACCSPASSVALTPMKELPAKACSVSLKDASSLGTSRSDSISNNDAVSSSSSCSPSTSSW
ncbi:PREDICTED: uncharacterized protein LOC109186225 [Ipomoea nil]|uniref:uncharacterized protein LOC109186225 n=1 Tax=Ipomoea nil TaxID=35883 RepID=UPI0009011330|nr:PREDICTED: uncharacterized protein LOC109186225 [Ipomoea nil]